ncbi:oligoribonuclease [Nocardioides limicola]|uniref:oligoribonuclease n=1 Tax=Nocardioides limicola TaxID=2803368 RepID=UPI00193B2965|nr:oligoribonuclease [Nocardioides sp. DJM-14]
MTATLLWLDLEMTGLDPVEDRICEVAAIATDWEFTEVGRYQATKKVGPALMKRRMVGDFWDAHPQVRDALQAANLDGQNGRTVENELLDFVEAHFDADTPVLLAGNSIHTDRRFIAHEWPRLDARLHYRMLDVSAWKVVFEGRFGEKFTKTEAHRALSDIEESIAELRFYLSKLA